MKVSLNKPASGFNLAAIVENFTTLENEFQNKVLYRNNPTGEPNTMETDLDMNGKRIINASELSVGGVNLSSLNSAFIWRGAWSNSTLYAKSDAVSYGGSSYICVTPHTGSTPPSANWNLLAQAGASGLGDVFGPASSVSGNIPVFSNTTGKLLSDSGITVATGGAVESFLESTTAAAARTAIGAADSASVSSLVIMNRNRITNGDFKLDQRCNNTQFTANTYNHWACDRWGILATGATSQGKVATQRIVNANTPLRAFPNYMRITTLTSSTPVSTDALHFGQAIELGNTIDWEWGTANAKAITISFWARSSLTGTFSGAIQSRSVARTYVFNYTISAANTWEFKTITVPGDTAVSSAWGSASGILATLPTRLAFDLGSGTDYRGTAGSWVNQTWTGSTGSVSVVGTLNATLDLTAIQIEVGSVVSPFENVPFAVEVLRCERYAQFLRASSGPGFGFTQSGVLGTGPTAVYLHPISLVAPMNAYGDFGLYRDDNVRMTSFSWVAAFPSAGTSQAALFIPRTGAWTTVGGTNAINFNPTGYNSGGSLIHSVSFSLQSGSTFTGPNVGDTVNFMIGGSGHIISCDVY